ncbi:hypothetical protein H0H87_005584, partial [Tephrocybe sp. NHM501043]
KSPPLLWQKNTHESPPKHLKHGRHAHITRAQSNAFWDPADDRRATVPEAYVHKSIEPNDVNEVEILQNMKRARKKRKEQDEEMACEDELSTSIPTTDGD